MSANNSARIPRAQISFSQYLHSNFTTDFVWNAGWTPLDIFPKGFPRTPFLLCDFQIATVCDRLSLQNGRIPNGRSVKLPVMENTAISLVVARWFHALAGLLNSYMSRKTVQHYSKREQENKKMFLTIFDFLYFFLIFFSGQYEIYLYRWGHKLSCLFRSFDMSCCSLSINAGQFAKHLFYTNIGQICFDFGINAILIALYLFSFHYHFRP